MQCVILSSVACPVLQYVSTLSHKRHDLVMVLLNVSCVVLIFSTTFVGNISHSKKNWAIYKKCLLAFISITSYSCHILKKLEFSQQAFYKYSNKFHENPSSVSRAVPNGRRKDTTKLIVVFRNSVNAAKKWKRCLLEKVTCWMNVGRGVNVAAVGRHYGEHDSTIMSIKKNYDQWKCKGQSFLCRRDPFLENV